jgi:hypothetical protein
MMVSMAALQVFVVRFFFQGARKGTFFSAYYVGLDLVSRLLDDFNSIPLQLLLLALIGHDTNILARLRVMSMKSNI